MTLVEIRITIVALALISLLSTGCSSGVEQIGAGTTEQTQEESTTTATTMPLPPDLETPPTAYFDPPLDLSGLIGRKASEGVAWGEKNNFQEVFVMDLEGGIDGNAWPARLVLVVDDSDLIVSATQG